MLTRNRQDEDAIAKAIMGRDDIEALANSVMAPAHRRAEERLAAARRERTALAEARSPIFQAWDQAAGPRIPAELAAIDDKISALEGEIRTLRVEALAKRAAHAERVCEVTEPVLRAAASAALAVIAELRPVLLTIDAVGAVRERHHGGARTVELARLVDDLEMKCRRWSPR